MPESPHTGPSVPAGIDPVELVTAVPVGRGPPGPLVGPKGELEADVAVEGAGAGLYREAGLAVQVALPGRPQQASPSPQYVLDADM